jgi:hypothetical protein
MEILPVASLESTVTVNDLLPVGTSTAVRAVSRFLARPEVIEELLMSCRLSCRIPRDLSHRLRLATPIEFPYRDPGIT